MFLLYFLDLFLPDAHDGSQFLQVLVLPNLLKNKLEKRFFFLRNTCQKKPFKLVRKSKIQRLKQRDETHHMYFS